jgi:hypothetical protein
MTDDLVKRLREGTDWYKGDCEIRMEAALRIEALEKALRRLVAWGAACPTTREDRLSHTAEGAKAFHAARAVLGEEVHD